LDTKPWIDIHRIKPPFPRLALSVLPNIESWCEPRLGRAPCGAPPGRSPPRASSHTRRAPPLQSRHSPRADTMHATPKSVLALAPSRGAARPVLRGRSSLPPAAHRMRRGSLRPERSRIRGDDGWRGATRQSVILAIHSSHNSHCCQVTRFAL